MFDRGQSEGIGVILLTAVITLTVTGTGAVVMSEWQSDIDQGPVADIEAELTPINLSLEHRGGNTLYPENTTIRLAGVDEEVTLEEPLRPGTSLSRDFERLNGTVELFVLHDPSDTVVFSETYRIENRIEQLLFDIANRSDPAYVLEGYPANYTVRKEFVVGVSEIATEEASLTVGDESVADVNAADTTITGTDTAETRSTTVTAEIDDAAAETELVVLDTPQMLQVDTVAAASADSTAVNATGELVDLDDLPAVDLGFEYTPLREFNGYPGVDIDSIITYGQYREAADDYTHNDGWLHDNRPLSAGETRTYIYDNAEADADLFWAFRDRERTQRDGSTDDIENDVYSAGGGNRDEYALPDGTFRIEVSLSEDGDTADVRVYDSLTGDAMTDWSDSDAFTDIDVSAHSALYFSSYEYYGVSDTDRSLRLTGVFDSSSTEAIDVESDARTDQRYSEEIGGLEADREYVLEAVADVAIGGQTVRDTGGWKRFNTTGPTVETLNVDALDPRSINASGNLTLDSAQQADLGFEYTPLREFDGNPAVDSDSIITYGQYREAADDYTHNDGWLHDNRPLANGSTRTYIYDNSAADADLFWAFRDRERTQRDESTSDIRDEFYTAGGGNRDDNPLPDGTYRIEVSRSDDGRSADVRVYDEATGGTVRYSYTGIDVSRHSELYFSSYEYYGVSGADSLRLTSVFDESDSERTDFIAGITTDRTYDQEIDGLEPYREYAVAAVAEQSVDGTTVRDTGVWKRTTTTGPTVETLGSETLTPVSVNATGELLDFGTADQTDLGFDYVQLREFIGNPYLDRDKIVAYGEYREAADDYTHNDGWLHDNRPLVNGSTRTYVYDNSAADADLFWAFRNRERTQPDESTGDIQHEVYTAGGGSRDDNPLPSGTYRIEVTRSDDGTTADVRVYDQAIGGTIQYSFTDIDVSAHSRLYFSSYEYYGVTETDRSLRLIRVFDESDIEAVESATGVTTEGPYGTDITGLAPNQEYAVTAVAGRNIGDQDVTDTGEWSLFNTTAPGIESRSVDPPNATSINATVDVVDFGTAQRTNLSFTHVPLREFNGYRDVDIDSIITYGQYRETADDYTHDDGWLHDNRPLANGSTRTYIYDNSEADADLFWAFRDRKRTQPDESTGDIEHEVYTAGGGDRDDYALPDGTYRIEVSLSDDGETADVRVYDSLTGDTLRYEFPGIDVSAHSRLYFSSYEFYGVSDTDRSLRLTGVFDSRDTERTAVATGVTAEQPYSTNISELEPYREYVVAPTASQTYDGRAINTTGSWLRTDTNGPTVETRTVTANGSTSIDAGGELVELGRSPRTTLSFAHTPFREFNLDRADNGDNVISYGQHYDGLRGYTHDDGWIHDNKPLVNGSTRTYLFEAEYLYGDLYWAFRDQERTQRDEDVGDIEHEVYTAGGGQRDENPLPREAYRIEISLSEDGTTADFRLYDELSGGKLRYNDSGIDVSDHAELYFSNYEYYGRCCENSLRLTGIFDQTNTERTVVTQGVSTARSFDTTITGLDAGQEYAVAAVANRTVDGQNVIDAGEFVRVETDP